MVQARFFEALVLTLSMTLIFALSTELQRGGIGWQHIWQPGQVLSVSGFQETPHANAEELRSLFLTYANQDYTCNPRVVSKGTSWASDLQQAHVDLLDAERRVKKQIKTWQLMYYDNHPQPMRLYQYDQDGVRHIVAFEIRTHPSVKGGFDVIYQQCALKPMV